MRKECPICKSNTKKHLKTIKFAVPEYFHLPDQYDVVVCDCCGFCYAATEASIEDYDHYYSQCNFYSGVPNEHKWQIEENEKVFELAKAVSNKNGLLLDIGFGKGNLMRILRKGGFSRVCGLDPSKTSVEIMREEGFEVYEGSVFGETVAELKEKCNCVFLIDVLEHLLDPCLAIENILKYMKTGGTLIVSVPNYAALCDTDLYSTYPIIPDQFNQEHINYFSSVSLDNLLKAYGLCRISSEQAQRLEMTDGPELLIAYRYKKSVKESKEERKDNFCSKVLVDYFEKNDMLEQVINRKVTPFVDAGEPVYVWGTGSYAMWLLANTRMNALKIEAFIDNNPTKVGKMLYGKRIISVEELKQDVPILICAMKYSADIENHIKLENLSNIFLVI